MCRASTHRLYDVTLLHWAVGHGEQLMYFFGRLSTRHQAERVGSMEPGEMAGGVLQ